MGSLEQFIKFRRHNRDPELFAIVLTLRYIRALIQPGGSDIWRPGDDSAFHPYHLEVFLVGVVERAWKDQCVVQKWRRIQQLLPQVERA